MSQEEPRSNKRTSFEPGVENRLPADASFGGNFPIQQQIKHPRKPITRKWIKLQYQNLKTCSPNTPKIKKTPYLIQSQNQDFAANPSPKFDPQTKKKKKNPNNGSKFYK